MPGSIQRYRDLESESVSLSGGPGMITNEHIRTIYHLLSCGLGAFSGIALNIAGTRRPTPHMAGDARGPRRDRAKLSLVQIPT